MNDLGRWNESDRLLDVLRDPLADDVEREQAFARMLEITEHAWWGERGSLMDFTAAVAKGYTHAKLRPYGIPVDRVDHEGFAGEALMILFRNARQIRREPRDWLVGVVRNLARAEIRAAWPYLTSAEIPDEHADDKAGEREREALCADERVIDAIRSLPPSLKPIAELLLIHQIPRSEICTYLEISDDVLRKRIQRMREALQRSLRLNPEDQPTSEGSDQDPTTK
jgi:DNA-directed RNA polymerase specialized sigma24 family protein